VILGNFCHVFFRIFLFFVHQALGNDLTKQIVRQIFDIEKRLFIR